MNGGTPLTPSARISALNIVGDLLRKVGVSISSPLLPLSLLNNIAANLKHRLSLLEAVKCDVKLKWLSSRITFF